MCIFNINGSRHCLWSGHKQHRYICSNSQQYIVWVKIIHFYVMPKIIRILRSCSMKIFCTVNISKRNCKTGANVSVPMCLGPPSRGQKAPLRIHKSCLLHMSSRTQHTGGIHKAVSCICNSNIQGCSTLGDPHPVLTVPSFPPPLTTENSLKNPCNVICTNK